MQAEGGRTDGRNYSSRVRAPAREGTPKRSPMTALPAREGLNGFSGTPSPEPTAADILVIAGCSRGVAPPRAEIGPAAAVFPTFNSRPRPSPVRRWASMSHEDQSRRSARNRQRRQLLASLGVGGFSVIVTVLACGRRPAGRDRRGYSCVLRRGFLDES